MKLSKWCGLAVLLAAMLGSTNIYAQSTNEVDTSIGPNTLAAASYFEDVCLSYLDNLGVNSERRTIQAATPQGQDALRNACGVYQQFPATTVQKFFEGIDPTGFVSFKVDSLLFAQSENASVMDRMQALRRNGAADASAYNINSVALGGGASADDSGLLGKKLGLWFRLNSASGTKDQTLLTDKLDSSQFGGSVGMDYRVSDNAVIGGVLGYRHSSAKFGNGGAAGKMDSSTLNLSGYFSSYLYKSLYLDSVINYGKASYDTRRNVSDLSIPTLTIYSPDGSTDGNTLSGSVALGYEFAANGWTITPSVHYMYIDSKIDAFEESGAGPFDLSYDRQHYTSSSARLDLNVSYAVSGESAVWLPHLRVEAIKEFGANIDTFDVRFINDPSATPVPLTVLMDELDDQYFRVSLGVSAQFHNDISAYLDYQQLLSFDAVSLRSVVAGLRFQF